MSYTFDPALPLIDTVRQVAREQIDGAIESLEDADANLEEAVHDTRKRCKKLRGLLRLVRPGLGNSYSEENAAFRDLARTLSDIRDAQMLAETIDKLEEHARSDAAAKVLDPVRDWAARRRREVQRENLIAAQIDAAHAALRKARKRAAKWDIGDPDAAIRAGLRRTYARARGRWHEATDDDDPALLHEWRKRVKYHWYHCRLLRAAWPEAMKARAGALDELADDLGTDHDLVVLLATLRDEAADLPAETVGALGALARSRSRALREDALRRAPKLFIETPKALSRRLAGQWNLAAA
jgi:CHAD domain-containing protein